MFRLICAIALLLAASCTPEEPPSEFPDPTDESLAEETRVTYSSVETASGVKLVPKIYWISSEARQRIPHRVLDAINALRLEKDLPTVSLSSELVAAAKTHARDMSNQNRPWHFGSDGSSPISRAEDAGYTGKVLGENISESFESDLETLAAWMRNPETRKLILSAEAQSVGIGWHQETNGKIWWALVVGT